jgi:hypothetical protein
MKDLLFWAGVIALITAGPPLYHRLLTSRAESWIEVEGHIESFEVFGFHGFKWGRVENVLLNRTSESFWVRLFYSYKVQDEWYSGEHKRLFQSEIEARVFGEQLKGRPVLIRFKPGRPEKSLLWQVIGEV